MKPNHAKVLILGIIVTASLWLAGCSTTKEYVATGGSRADGTVDLSYEYVMFESPVENVQQGTTVASSTCAGWGYSASQPFGGETQRCEAVNGYGSCIRWLVTRRYQCLGSPDSARSGMPASAAIQNQGSIPVASSPSAPISPRIAPAGASQVEQIQNSF